MQQPNGVFAHPRIGCDESTIDGSTRSNLGTVSGTNSRRKRTEIPYPRKSNVSSFCEQCLGHDPTAQHGSTQTTWNIQPKQTRCVVALDVWFALMHETISSINLPSRFRFYHIFKGCKPKQSVSLSQNECLIVMCDQGLRHLLLVVRFPTKLACCRTKSCRSFGKRETMSKT